jgi:hypothetical protein
MGHPTLCGGEKTGYATRRFIAEPDGLRDSTDAEFIGGAKRDRTADLLVANEALSQLSYSPTRWEQPALF